MVEVYKKKGGRIAGEEKAKEKKPARKIKSHGDSDSDYDMEVMAPEGSKAKKVGGGDGFEVVPKHARKYCNNFYFIFHFSISCNCT